MKYILILLLLTINTSGANGGIISFDQLKNDEKLAEQIAYQEVEIRGFIYRQDGKGSILAPQPNLKSCCIGSQANVKQQLYLIGSEVESSSRAVTVQGIFRIEPLYDDKGKLKQLYVLDQAVLLEKGSTSMVPWLVLGVILIALLYRSR